MPTVVNNVPPLAVTPQIRHIGRDRGYPLISNFEQPAGSPQGYPSVDDAIAAARVLTDGDAPAVAVRPVADGPTYLHPVGVIGSAGDVQPYRMTDSQGSNGLSTPGRYTETGLLWTTPVVAVIDGSETGLRATLE